ncbi:hypothetical protein BCV69DRAFT_300658 [Microstroma glucosiphilum]|uniref:SET domain-containing protein n=1 Tax=Pseudomicrostroma glucosiphilum TaxID=1684307 RepID=A0A316U2A9_9BASI|nr:hypothetical protein BCV69DRAFT_300658 [Pseudomicrostroma glucosiphilum]PWN19340.1 hypothetical protein BCV69DRAFT_300658 [Pseudomicrostroma glucosiphilum]
MSELRDTGADRQSHFLVEGSGSWRATSCGNITVKTIEGKGRGAFWEPEKGETCKAGTLLFASEPLLQVVGIPHLATHCSHCILPISGKLFVCKGCKVLKYCSARCQSVDARWHRDIECQALRRWTKLGSDIRGKGKEWFETQWVGPLEGDTAPAPESGQSNAGEIVTDHAAPTRLVRAVGRALFAQKKGVSVEKEGILFDDLHGEPPTVQATLMSMDLQKKWSATLTQLRQYLCVAEGLGVKHAVAGDNRFMVMMEREYGLSEPDSLSVTLSKVKQNCFSNEAQGISLYGLLSLVNSSCVPNCTVIEDPVDGRKVIFARRDIVRGEELTFSYSHLSSPRWIRQLHCFIEYGYTCSCSVCVATEQTLEILKKINEVYDVEKIAESTEDMYAKELQVSRSLFVDARDVLWCAQPDCEGRRPLPEPTQAGDAPPVLTFCNTCFHLSVVPNDLTKYIMCAPSLLKEYQSQPSSAGRTWEEAYPTFNFFASLAHPCVEGIAGLLKQGRDLLVRLGEDDSRDEDVYPLLAIIEGIIRIALLELQGLQEGCVYPSGSIERLMALGRVCEYLEEHRAISLALGVETYVDAAKSLRFRRPFPPFPVSKGGREALYVSLVKELKSELEVVQSSEGLRLLAVDAIEWKDGMTLDSAIVYLEERVGVLEPEGWKSEGIVPFVTGG